MMITRQLAIGTLLLASGLCGAPARTAQAAPGAVSQESLVELLPARARVALLIRKNAIASLRDLVFNDPEMMRELSPYLQRSFGVDVTRVEGVAAFTLDVSSGEPKLAMIFRLAGSTSGPLKLAKVGEAHGTPLYSLGNRILCARTKTGLVVGNEAEVRAAVAVDRGREPALPRDVGLGRLLDADAKDIDFALAVGPGALPPDKTMGVEDGVLVYRRNGMLELSLRGDPTQLAGLREMALGAMQMALANLEQQKAKETATNDPMKGAAGIVAYHQTRKLFAELEPRVEGNALKLHYKLPDPQALGGSSVGVAIIGVLAAVAIPSYQKYMRRGKTVEASVNLGRLAEAIRMLKLVNKKGRSVLRATDWTPKAGCCGQAGDRCAPDLTAWQGPTWSALGFSIDEPHYFQYRVQIEGSGGAARYIVEARADLDCNGKFSNYKRVTGPEDAQGPLESRDEAE